MSGRFSRERPWFYFFFPIKMKVWRRRPPKCFICFSEVCVLCSEPGCHGRSEPNYDDVVISRGHFQAVLIFFERGSLSSLWLENQSFTNPSRLRYRPRRLIEIDMEKVVEFEIFIPRTEEQLLLPVTSVPVVSAIQVASWLERNDPFWRELPTPTAFHFITFIVWTAYWNRDFPNCVAICSLSHFCLHLWSASAIWFCLWSAPSQLNQQADWLNENGPPSLSGPPPGVVPHKSPSCE